MKNKIRNISIIGIFSALSVILVLFIHFPIFPAVAFLEYDPADIPIFLITAALGPWYGLIMTVVVSVIQGITVSAASGGVTGIFMHIFATGSFVLAEGLVIKGLKRRSSEQISTERKIPKTSRIIGGICAGVVAMTLVMALWNLILTPIFMGLPLAAVLALYPYIVAFNLIKAIINGAIAFIFYKALEKIIYKYL